MKKRHLALLVLALLVLATCYYLVKKQDAAPVLPTNNAYQTQLMPRDFRSENLSMLIINNQTGTITLQRHGDDWQVAERYGYPASLYDLKTLLLDLCETKITQFLDLDESQRQDVNLTDKATTLTLLNCEGKTILKLAFGDKHYTVIDQINGETAPTGRFLKLQDDTCVIVPNTFARIDDTVQDWLQKDFLKLGEIQELTMLEYGGKVIWHVFRAQDSQSFSTDMTVPQGMKFQPTIPDNLVNSLNKIKLSDVASPQAKLDATGMINPNILRIKTSDGLVYEVIIGTIVNKSRFLKIIVSAGMDNNTNQSDSLTQIANQENQRLAPWCFQVDARLLSSLPFAADDFFR